jgi:GTP-binding protein LepA
MDGEIKPKDKIKIFSNGHEHLVDEVGVFTPKRVKTTSLKAGEVGCIIESKFCQRIAEFFIIFT